MNTLDPLELAILIEKNLITEHGLLEVVLCLRQQQDEIEALKKRCLDEIFNRTYADRSAEVLYDHWELAQAEIEVLHQILGYEGIEVGKEYLDECVAELRKAQEK